MILKKQHWILALALWASYSYSNISPYYGYTSNATLYGTPWNMDSVLPDPTGLEVNGVFYTYTPNKVTADDFEVNLGNWNADKTGYIWNETDNWDGSPGGVAIIKSIPLPYTHRSQIGEGFLNTTGTGTVEDASLIYSYRVDPCYNPQADINCPGFIPPTPPVVEVAEIYDATEDAEMEEVETDNYKESKDDSDSEKSEEEEEEERKERLERALMAVDSSGMFAEGLAQQQMLQQMNAAINVSTYLNKVIQGGTYAETVHLEGGTLPDNNGAKRMNWATQKLHEEMINMQYEENTYE